MLMVVLLSTEFLFRLDNDNAPYDDSIEALDVIQWKKNSEGIKEEEDKIFFNFLDVDENWKERYSEGGNTNYYCPHL